jgi:hypothetical protein
MPTYRLYYKIRRKGEFPETPDKFKTPDELKGWCDFYLDFKRKSFKGGLGRDECVKEGQKIAGDRVKYDKDLYAEWITDEMIRD